MISNKVIDAPAHRARETAAATRTNDRLHGTRDLVNKFYWPKPSGLWIVGTIYRIVFTASKFVIWRNLGLSNDWWTRGLMWNQKCLWNS